MYQLSKALLRLAVFYVFALFIVLFSFIILPAKGENVKDSRLMNLRDPDHFKLSLKPVQSLNQWEERKKQLRETVLLKTGLWPEPVKTPLNAKIFDERKGDGFAVAKVYFESLPGFLVTGNLYRPTSGTGPYPAIITPHGHWEYGRLQNSTAGSIPGRCIDFARQGFVVFSIDMIGYNDSFQLPHDPYKSRAQLKADMQEPYEPRLFRGDFDFPEAVGPARSMIFLDKLI